MMNRWVVTGWLAGSFLVGMCAATAVGQIVEGGEGGTRGGSTTITVGQSVSQDETVVPTMDFQMVVADESGAVNVISGGAPAFTYGFSGFNDALAAPMPGFGGDMMSMLNQASVQRDLELSDDQRDQLQRLRQDFTRKVSDQARLMREGNFSPEAGRGLGETIRELQKQQEADVEQILLPHQVRRLREISFQTRMKTMGPTGALSDKAIAEELGLSSEQLKRLKEKAKEVGRDLKEKIERLREEAQQELLKELTRDQLNKLERMLGDRFEFPKDDQLQPPGLRFKRPSERDE